MRKYSHFFILIFVCCTPQVLAQEAQLKIYGERNNDVVTLAWIPELWPLAMEGVIIKRKEGNGAWQVVTPSLVIPASYPDKDLTNVEPLASERHRLSNKLNSMIANGKANPVPEKEYFENILQNSASLSGIAFIFALDYDLILLNGFGCVDRNLKPNASYTYGFFPVFAGKVNDQPVADFNAPASGKPELDLAMEASSEVIGNNIKLRLHWRFDLEEFRRKNIKGFNLYQKKQGEKATRLNDNVIWITSKENPADLNYLVDFPASDVEYSAVPISYFGTEGELHSTKFRPAAYNIIIPAPKLSFIINNQQLNLSWEIDHAYDTLIVKFDILKKTVDENYLLTHEGNSRSRKYVAEINSSGEQSRYKIIAQTITGKEIWSNECVINYQPRAEVPPPLNLLGRIIQQEDEVFIELQWDYPQTDAEIDFRIFTNGPDGNLIFDSSYPRDLSTPFRIEVKKSRGQIYHFAVQARTASRITSPLSNEIEILAPSKILPPISITKISAVNDEVLIEWKFADGIADMQGFKILVDGVEFIPEGGTTLAQRASVLKGLPSGKHTISIIAVTQFGLEGRPSISKNIIIP